MEIEGYICNIRNGSDSGIPKLIVAVPCGRDFTYIPCIASANTLRLNIGDSVRLNGTYRKRKYYEGGTLKEFYEFYASEIRKGQV